MTFICVATALVLIGIALKIYIKLNTRWNNSYACLANKTVIVTGANTGLGYAIALDFAMRGARVILACRSKERGDEARDKIVSATKNENVLVKILDLQSFESVRTFAKDFNETESRLDILMNNAGVVNLGDARTRDGLLAVMQVNHISPFLLTHLLIDKLKHTPSSRIVNMSSYSAKMSNLRADEMDVFPTSRFADMSLYANSKLCNILFTIELAKKLEDTGVRTYCVHPGATITDATRNFSEFQQTIYRLTANPFYWTPEEGAQAAIYCALSKEVEGHEGEIFGNCKKLRMYEGANDVVLAKEVWRNSEKLAKLEDFEKLR